MTDTAFDTLRAAVSVARHEQVQTVDGLRKRLKALGHAQPDIDAALEAWRDHYRRRGVPL